MISASSIIVFSKLSDGVFPLCSSVQNGKEPSVEAEVDPVKRYVRNSRDLSRLVESDTIFT